MKIKTNDLTGLALNWAVDRCLPDAALCAEGPHPYSTDWAQGGPIIEREKMDTQVDEYSSGWRACIRHFDGEDEDYSYGPTPLIAAMRCFIASQLGDEVEVPDELLENRP